MSTDPYKRAQRVVDWMRENTSRAWHLNDYELYETAKMQFPNMREELEKNGNPFSPEPTQSLVTTPKTSAEADYSPKKLEGLTSFWNTADAMAGEGGWGMPKEFFQQAYNESMAGMIHAAANGEFKYDVGDYEPGLWGEVGQFIVGTMNPVDAALFIGLPLGGAKVGAPIANKFLTKWTAKGMANGIRKKIGHSPIGSSIYEGIIEQGLGFGAYSAAAGAIGNAAQQATKQGDYAKGDGTIDPWEVTKASTAAGAEGLVLGAVTGGTGKGIGHQFSKWRLDKDAGLLKRVTKRVLNTGTQVGVEAAEFTAIPYAVHGIPTNKDGTINLDQVKHDMAHNTILITSLKTIMNKGNLFKLADNDMKGFANSIKKTVGRKINAENKSKNNVKIDLEEQGGLGDILAESIKETDGRIYGILEGVELTTKKLARLNDLHRKVNGNRATKEEMAEFVELATEIMPLMEGVYTEILENEQFRKDLGIEEFGIAVQKQIEGRIYQIQKARDTYNDLDRLNEAGGVIVPGIGEGKPGISRKKNLSEMSDIELVDEAARLTEGKDQDYFRKEFGDIIPDLIGTGEKIIINRERLIKFLEETPTDIPTTDSHKEFKSKSAEEVGLSGDYKNRRKSTMDDISEMVENLTFEGDSNQTAKYNESKGFLENLVRNIFPNRKGGGGAKGQDYIEKKSMVKEIKDLNELAKYLAKRNKSFLSMDENDITGFLANKKKTVAHSINSLIKYVEVYNPNVKGILAGQIVSKTGEIRAKDKGVRVDNIGEGDFVQFRQSKVGEPMEIPITPELKGMLTDLIKANKQLGKSFDFIDMDGISHEFLFWTNEGNPITDKRFIEFLKVASKEVGRNITPKMFRKSFASFARGKGIDDQLMQYIDAEALGHSTTKKGKGLLDRYAEFSKEQQQQYKDLLKEFTNEVFGTQDLPVKTGEKSATTYELRQIVDKIRETDIFEKARLTSGKKGKKYRSIDGKDFEALLRYFVETNARGTDILPNDEYLSEIGFKKPSVEVKPKVESKKPIKIDEIDTAEKSVEYWTGKEGREAGIKLSQSKKLVELNKELSYMEEYIVDPSIPPSPHRARLITQRAKLMKQLGLKDIKKRTDAQRIKGEVEFQGKDIQAERNKFIDEVLKKNNLTREQLKEAGLDANTLGEFGDGIIKLQRGEWQPADFYHENLHRLKAFAKKIGNKSLIKLIEKAEGLGKTSKEYKKWKEKNPNRDMEEFLADIVGGKASRINFTKGMIPKLKQFIKQIVSKVKTALGVGNFNDYARVLSKKVQKGFATKGVQFGKGVKKRTKEIIVTDSKEQAKVIKEKFDLLLENIFGTDVKEARNLKGEFIKELARMAGVENPQDVTVGNLSKLSGESLEMIKNTLNSPRVEKLKRQKDMIKWLKEYDIVDKFQLAANVSDKASKIFLEGFGVKDGDITNANIKQLEMYKNYLKDLGFKELQFDNWMEEAYKFNLINESQKEMIAKFDSFVGETKRLSLPLESVVRSLGFNKLANKLFEHTSAESDYIGNLVTFEDNVIQHFGGGRSGKKSFNKNKDYFYLMDSERRIARQKEGLLTKGEKEFIRKAFDKDGKFNLDTAEGKALNEIKKFNELIKEKFLDALKRVMTNAEFERWKSDANIKWLDSGEYMHRSLSEHFKKGFSITSKAFKDAVKKEAGKITDRILEQEGIKGESARNKRALEIQDEAFDMARQYFYDRGNYTQTRISARFLQERHGKLDEKVFSEHHNKEIDVYDTSYDRTVKKYALGMAKYTANVEFFPEYIKLKGHKFRGISRNEIQVLKEMEGGSKVESFLSRTVENQLGVYKAEVGYDNTVRFLNDWATMLAKLQLSYPTSGIKNLLVGNYQTLGVVSMRDFFRGFFDIFDADVRRELRKTGGTEVGLRNIDNQISIFGEGKIINKTFDFIFKGGLMKPTEDINRYIAIRASLHQQNRLVNILQMGNKTSRKYKNAEQKLKRFYRMTDEDITMLKKHGMAGADGMKAGVDAANVSRRMNQIYQKMNTAAHIYTQGATLDLFMPDWAGKGIAKPATLYKRMAYAATVNTLKNGKIAWDTGSPVRAFMPAIGSLFAGKTLMGIYDHILGQSPDKENGDLWDNLFATLWKGEFMGIFSEFMNPSNSQGFMTTPAIYNHGFLIVNSVFELYTGKSNKTQTLDAFAKGTFGFYNQIGKTWKNKDLKSLGKSYNGKFKRFRKIYNDYLEEVKPGKSATVIGKDELTPYFKDFLIAFNTGTEKEFARHYALTALALANKYYQEGFETTGKRVRNLKEAFKEAKKTMDKKMKLLNPNKGSIVGKKGISKRRALLFLKWLKENGTEKQLQELTSLEAEYSFKVRSFNSNKNKYFKELNLPELKDEFKWN